MSLKNKHSTDIKYNKKSHENVITKPQVLYLYGKINMFLVLGIW